MNIKDDKNYQNHFIKGKVIEGIIGLILLLPPIIGVILFILGVSDIDDGEVVKLSHLSSNWSMGYDVDGGGGAMSATPIYLALMAMAGAYLIKDSIGYILYYVNTEND